MKKKIKERECAATGCSNLFLQYNSTQKVCSLNCAIQYAEEKREKDELREARKRKKELTEQWELETLSEKMNKLQKVFNEFIRLRDEGKECCSCPTILKRGLKYDAGHLYSVGKFPELRFHELNVHGQCVHCNQHLHSNGSEYRKKIVKRIGSADLELLDSLAHKSRHYMRHEIDEMIDLYKEKIKDMKKNRC